MKNMKHLDTLLRYIYYKLLILLTVYVYIYTYLKLSNVNDILSLVFFILIISCGFNAFKIFSNHALILSNCAVTCI